MADVHSHLCDATDVVSWVRVTSLWKLLASKDGCPTDEITVNFIQESKSSFLLSVNPKIASIKTVPGSNSMVFIDITNNDNHPVVGIAINTIDPVEASLYFYKVLCFCYNDYIIFNNNSVEYPILFSISEEIGRDPLLKNIKNINVIYSFYDYKFAK